MKQLSILAFCLLTVLTIHAQQISNVVTIAINGNKNLQLTIDGKEYSLNDGSTIGDKTTFDVDNLVTGQHNIQVMRTDLNTNRPEKILTSFYLRAGFDMLINVNPDGSLELLETRTGDSDLTPISSTEFNTLIKNVRAQRSVTGRNNLITAAFNSAKNSFSTQRVGQLLSQVSSENFRLSLAKLSYRVISDRGNFYQLYNLLNSQASRNELADYVYNYGSGSNSTAMSDADFDALYRSIQQQWPVSTQMNSLVNAFNNTSNFFTTSQAGRLIQLVSAENNRLQLAKLSYRSVIDRNNFYQVYELLSSQSSRNELEVYVNNYESTGPGVAMSDANFNALYRGIQQQWPVSTQMNSLINTFNNTSNYFTTYQASRLIQLVSTESNRLQLAKLSYRSIVDRNNFSQIFNLLNSQASKNELQNYINMYGSTKPATAMSDEDFNSLYQSIQQQWPVSTQMNSLTNAFNNTSNFFTSYQASRLIQLVGTENDRLQLAKLSYRSITDRNNFYLVFNLLSSQGSKNDLQTYINNYGTGTTPKVPMSDAEFNSLYRTIELQFIPFEKLNSLTNAFNNPSYYFTTIQAKKLIPLVSLESNRLQLAKLSYRTITDRNNFSQLYDILSSQASRDELDAYVRAYKE